jgi:RNA polymerase sigma-70 factor (ECF subfamily)
VDSAEFDDFYRGTARRLLQYAYGMCGDLGAAQDLTQEAYVRAWRQWRRIRAYEHPEAWLRLVVNRMCTDWWRRLAVHKRLPVDRLEHAPAPSENSVLLTAALRQVPPAQRRVLVLHYLIDMSVSDIAAETGTSIGAVKAHLSRGRERLAEILGDQRVGTEANGGR